MSLLPAAAATYRHLRRLPGWLPLRWLLLLGLLAGCAPTLSQLSAARGSVGEEVQLYGRHLGRVREVRFGGVAQPFVPVRRPWRRGWTSPVEVPAGAASGPLTLVTAAGPVPTQRSFRVVPVDSNRNFGAGPVTWLAVQPDGRILVAGGFRWCQGRARPGLARLLPGGDLDDTFVPPPTLALTDPPLALLQPGGRVLLSGQGGGLLALGPDGRPDATFQPDTLPGPVTALATRPGGRVVLGCGDADTPDSLRLQQLLPDGRPDPDFATPDRAAWPDSTADDDGPPDARATVQTLAGLPDGRLLVGLDDDNGPGWLLRCRPDGTPELPLDLLPPALYGPDPSRYDTRTKGIFAQADGHLVVAQQTRSRYFTSYSLLRLAPDGQTARWLLRPRLGSRDHFVLVQPDSRILLATSTRLHPWRTSWLSLGRPPVNAHFFEPPSRARRRQMWREFHGGLVRAAWQGRHDTRHWLRRLLPDGRPDRRFHPGCRPPDGPVVALAAQPDGKVLVGGYFSSYRGHTVPGLLRLNADGSFDDTFRP